MKGKFRWLLGITAALAVSTSASADLLELTGTVRDFKRGDQAGGHPDFQTAGAMGRFGHVRGLVGMDLGEDGKPVYAEDRPNKDTIQSADTLAQWYKDSIDINLSDALTLTLDNGLSVAGGVYTFESSSFWPIDGKMFGNQGLNHNFHFTFELKTKFTYRPGQTFTFIGDDDVWVYINGKKVIDLGGVHAAVTGSVLLFDGKVFVEGNDFSVGGDVQMVSNSEANKLRERWEKLGLGTCPIVSGDKYIDMNLDNDLTEVRCEFNSTSVKCWGAQDLSNVVIQFEDGTEQKFDNLNQGSYGEFRGTGAYEGKKIIGCWVKAGNNKEEDSTTGKGTYVSADGTTESIANLAFFFAERHTTQSNFRIDTTISLVSEDPSTVSPMYD